MDFCILMYTNIELLRVFCSKHNTSRKLFQKRPQYPPQSPPDLPKLPDNLPKTFSQLSKNLSETCQKLKNSVLKGSCSNKRRKRQEEGIERRVRSWNKAEHCRHACYVLILRAYVCKFPHRMRTCYVTADVAIGGGFVVGCDGDDDGDDGGVAKTKTTWWWLLWWRCWR